MKNQKNKTKGGIAVKIDVNERLIVRDVFVEDKFDEMEKDRNENNWDRNYI